MKYRKRPIIVDAFQWFERDQCRNPAVWYNPDDGYYVLTIHGQRATLADGDWVITEPDRVHHYPCKPDIFAATYEPAGEA